MYTQTLAIAYFFVSIAASITNAMIYFIRKDLSYRFFALSFSSLGTGMYLLAMQGKITLWISLVLGNLLIISGYLLLVSGLRAINKEKKLWPNSFWIYLILCILNSVIFTFVYDSFAYRFNFFNALAIAMSVSVYLYLRERFSSMPKIVRFTLFGLISLQISFFVARSLLWFSTGKPDNLLVQNTYIANFTFVYFIIYTVVLSAVVLLMDSNRQLLEKKIVDQQTGLKNRSALRSLIQDETEANVLPSRIAAILIDIDNFGMFNDSLGHAAGDQIIVETIEKIQACIGCGDTLYRYDGDGFLALTHCDNGVEIDRITKNIQREVSKPIDINGRTMILTVSIGICLAGDGGSLAQIIKNSETALYIAKKQKNAVCCYRAEMDKAQSFDRLLEEDLSRAMENGELEVYYQPIIDVRTGYIKEAEALLRWNHPDFGLVSPAKFIPLAEKTKLILPMTHWIISQVSSKIAEWNKRGIELSVGVNLSVLSLENSGDELAKVIIQSIHEAGITPSSIKLEITESSLVNDLDRVLSIFGELRQFGVKLALDDFGTGYSSFGHLKDLPLDIIKLDRSLIHEIAENERNQMIVESMIKIIHGLKLEVIVEGVETREQFDQLGKLECDYIQGYLISKPLPAEEFEQFLSLFKGHGPKNFVHGPHSSSPEVRMQWRDEWKSGDDQIDRQHQTLMRDANLLLTSTLDGADKATRAILIKDLVEHVRRHFQYEESVLKKAGYPHHATHWERHHEFLSKALTMQEAYARDEIRSSTIFSFLMDEFILGHMIEEDVKFYPYTTLQE